MMLHGSRLLPTSSFVQQPDVEGTQRPLGIVKFGITKLESQKVMQAVTLQFESCHSS